MAKAQETAKDKLEEITKAATEKPKGARPVYNARARQAPDNDFMATIGAAWRFNDGDGLVVNLTMIPTQWDGKFILVPPKDDDAGGSD